MQSLIEQDGKAHNTSGSHQPIDTTNYRNNAQSRRQRSNYTNGSEELPKDDSDGLSQHGAKYSNFCSKMVK